MLIENTELDIRYFAWNLNDIQTHWRALVLDYGHLERFSTNSDFTYGIH